jgi:hypothetical protein
MGNRTAAPPTDHSLPESRPPEAGFSAVEGGKSHQIQSSFCSTSIIVKIAEISVIIQEKTLLFRLLEY